MKTNRGTIDVKPKHTDNKLERLLLIWLYFNPILFLLTNILDASAVSVISYAINVIILLYAFITMRATIQKRVLLFLLIYLALVFLNAVLVKYPYYVLVEGISSFVIFLPALYIISSISFDFKEFFRIWSKCTILFTLLLFILVFLYSKKLYHYGEFAYIVIPNVLALCYSIIINSKDRLVVNIILIFTNLIIILLFGGRTSAFVAFLIPIISIFLFSNKKKLKIIFTTCIIFLAIIMVTLFYVDNFYKNTIKKVNQTLYSVNLTSRTFWLLEQQINRIDINNNQSNIDEEQNNIDEEQNNIDKEQNNIDKEQNNIDKESDILDNEKSSSKNILDNLYMTNRDQLYKISVDFIKTNYGMPGGMAVIRYKTSGQFYYTHNFFLEIIIYFGVGGAILFFVLILFNIIKMYKYKYIYVFKMCIYLGLTYFLISLMGGNIFQTKISIMFLSMVFFYNEKQIDIK